MHAACLALALLLAGCAGAPPPATTEAAGTAAPKAASSMQASEDAPHDFPWTVQGLWWNRTGTGDVVAGITVHGTAEAASTSIFAGAAGVTREVGVLRLLYQVKDQELVQYGRYANVPDPFASVFGHGAPAAEDYAYEGMAELTYEGGRLGLRDVVQLAHDTVPGTQQVAPWSSSLAVVSTAPFTVSSAWTGRNLTQFNQWTLASSSGVFTDEANVVQGSTTFQLARAGELVLIAERGSTLHGSIHIVGPGTDLQWMPATDAFYRAPIDPGTYTVTAEWAGTVKFFGFAYEVEELSGADLATFVITA